MVCEERRGVCVATWPGRGGHACVSEGLVTMPHEAAVGRRWLGGLNEEGTGSAQRRGEERVHGRLAVTFSPQPAMGWQWKGSD